MRLDAEMGAVEGAEIRADTCRFRRWNGSVQGLNWCVLVGETGA